MSLSPPPPPARKGFDRSEWSGFVPLGSIVHDIPHLKHVHELPRPEPFGKWIGRPQVHLPAACGIVVLRLLPPNNNSLKKT